MIVRTGGVVAAEGISGPQAIVIRGGLIESIEDDPQGSASSGPTIDARDLVVGAGLLDIHTHGISGAQAIDGGPNAIREMAAAYARHGVTGFLATIGGSMTRVEAGIRGVVDYLHSGPDPLGSRCLGIHLEGPYINPSRPGAFVPSTILAPDASELERLAALASGSLRRITLAPEVPGMGPVIETARRLQIGCSAGHSEATAADMAIAIAAGVDSVTHTFNAMPSMHHREPGLVGTALTDERLIAEIVPDGVHVHPTVLGLVARARGWPGIALVTDSIAAAGLADGTYDFEEQRILVRGGEARLADGTLAGSMLTLDDGVRRFAVGAGVPWHEAHASASLVPSRLLGTARRVGRVAIGYDADLVAFDDARRVVWTMIGGDVVFDAEHRASGPSRRS